MVVVTPWLTVHTLTLSLEHFSLCRSLSTPPNLSATPVPKVLYSELPEEKVMTVISLALVPDGRLLTFILRSIIGDPFFTPSLASRVLCSPVDRSRSARTRWSLRLHGSPPLTRFRIPRSPVEVITPTVEAAPNAAPIEVTSSPTLPNFDTTPQIMPITNVLFWYSLNEPGLVSDP